MQTLVKVSATLAALAALTGQAIAQTPPAPPTHHSIFGRLFHPRAGTSAPMQRGTMQRGMMQPHGMMQRGMTGGIIGNKKSHVYHLPGDKGVLPATQNRVYFPSVAAAQAAGYRAIGGSHQTMRPRMHGSSTHGTPMRGTSMHSHMTR